MQKEKEIFIMKRKAIIVDIDGTLANNSHRQHLVNPKMNPEYEERINGGYMGISDGFFHKKTTEKFQKDWKSYNEAMNGDTPNRFCVELLNKMCPYAKDITKPNLSDEIVCIFVTGREEKYNLITMDQLWNWLPNLGRNFILFRKDNDYRPDTVIKKEIYHTVIKERYDVLFVLDDRASVVKMWREQGLVCLQCAEGDF